MSVRVNQCRANRHSAAHPQRGHSRLLYCANTMATADYSVVLWRSGSGPIRKRCHRGSVFQNQSAHHNGMSQNSYCEINYLLSSWSGEYLVTPLLPPRRHTNGERERNSASRYSCCT